MNILPRKQKDEISHRYIQMSQETVGVKVLQINMNRSRQSYDLTIATEIEMRVKVILASEPNRNALEDRKDRIFDKEMDTAIKVIDPDITLKE